MAYDPAVVADTLACSFVYDTVAKSAADKARDLLEQTFWLKPQQQAEAQAREAYWAAVRADATRSRSAPVEARLRAEATAKRNGRRAQVAGAFGLKLQAALAAQSPSDN